MQLLHLVLVWCKVCCYIQGREVYHAAAVHCVDHMLEADEASSEAELAEYVKDAKLLLIKILRSHLCTAAADGTVSPCHLNTASVQHMLAECQQAFVDCFCVFLPRFDLMYRFLCQVLGLTSSPTVGAMQHFIVYKHTVHFIVLLTLLPLDHSRKLHLFKMLSILSVIKPTP